MILHITLADINPFDATHCPSKEPPGFVAVDKTEGEHFLGALYCQRMMGDGKRIRPIAVCASHLVPAELRSALPWQRIDGFKRFWGHVLAGKSEISCIVLDEHRPGFQHGETMDVSEEEWAKLNGS